MPKLEFIKGMDPKAFFKDLKHIVVYAFSIGDRHYFRFDDFLNMPYQRAMQTQVYFKELDCNVDREFLKAHTQAFDNALASKRIDINTLVELKKLNDQMKQRLMLPKEPELMYKFASIVFFDQHENPYVYEFKYGENKIRAWKKNTSLEDFFLSKPLKELIPYLQHAGENLLQFSQMIQKQSQAHLDSILDQLSDEQKMILQNSKKLLPAQ